MSARARQRVAVALTLAVLAGYLLHAGVYASQLNDDAFITFRYSRNLVLGRGPVYNPGEAVEGYTNFLLMLMAAGAIAAFGPDEVLIFAKLVGVLSGLAAVALTIQLAARWLRSIDRLRARAGLLAPLAGGLVALDSGFALHSTTGLETTLFAALLILALLLADRTLARGRWQGLGLALALAALTRPEGVGLTVAILAGVALAGRRRVGRPVALDTALALLVIAAHLSFRYLTYHDLLPNTYYAKAGGIAWKASGVDYLLAYVAQHLAWIVPVLLAVAPLLAPANLRLRLLPALLTVAAGAAAVCLGGADWMPAFRLCVVYLPAAAALAALGAVLLIGRITHRRMVYALLLVPPGVMATRQWPLALQYHHHVETRTRGYLRGHAALADWLVARCRPGETIALMDIGLVGYRCIDLRILDITGLTDRTIAHSPGGFLDKRFDPAYVFDRRPRYIVLVLTDRPGSDIRTLELIPWTWIEDRLMASPDFERHYRRPVAEAAGAATDVRTRILNLTGATEVFFHDYPLGLYLLTVYEYHP